MVKLKKPDGGWQPNNALVVNQGKDETGAQAMARKLVEPAFKNAAATSNFVSKMLGGGAVELPGLTDYADALVATSDKAAEGDLAMASKMLAAQAVTLDAMFTELARRAALNMGDYINASEIYGRLALRAQGNCRATLEALGKLHQPREQTVRHVHVNEGGQAVIADQFHTHTGGPRNAEIDKQPYEQGARGGALPSPDPTRDGVPIASTEGPEAVQAPWRNVSGGADG